MRSVLASEMVARARVLFAKPWRGVARGAVTAAQDFRFSQVLMALWIHAAMSTFVNNRKAVGGDFDFVDCFSSFLINFTYLSEIFLTRSQPERLARRTRQAALILFDGNNAVRREMRKISIKLHTLIFVLSVRRAGFRQYPVKAPSKLEAAPGLYPDRTS